MPPSPVIPAEAAQPRRAGTQGTGLRPWAPDLHFAPAGMMVRGGRAPLERFHR
jgi:hypothetical protein